MMRTENRFWFLGPVFFLTFLLTYLSLDSFSFEIQEKPLPAPEEEMLPAHSLGYTHYSSFVMRKAV